MCHDFDPTLGLICCHPENPFSSGKRICCDCDGECCDRFDEERRDCFWPDFTHPTWLCCRILYGCDPLNRCDNDDDDNEDSRCRCRHHSN